VCTICPSEVIEWEIKYAGCPSNTTHFNGTAGVQVTPSTFCPMSQAVHQMTYFDCLSLFTMTLVLCGQIVQVQSP
jgi:hypothetical protein